MEMRTGTKSRSGTEDDNPGKEAAAAANRENGENRRKDDLLRLVYELPSDYADDKWDLNKKKRNRPPNVVTDQNGSTVELRATDKQDRDIDKDKDKDNLRTIAKCIGDKVRDIDSEQRTHLADTRITQSSSLGSKMVSVTEDGSSNGGLSPTLRIDTSLGVELKSPELSPCLDEDMETLNRILALKPHLMERWIKERAGPDEVKKLHSVTECLNTSESSQRTSVTSDLFQLWLASSPLKRSRSPVGTSCGGGAAVTSDGRRQLRNLDEAELFMELIRDVANELDIDVLCHKILVNVCLLTSADRGSLFLARGRYLHAKLFDVTRETELEEALKKASLEEIKIPFGIGVAGLAAESKRPINIRDAYADSRFNSDIDARTGYRTESILCMPICNYEGDVIGVAQIINKTDDSKEFSPRDVDVFRRYLTFCGIGIQNAQLFENSVLEYRRNQILLALARSIFEEQNNLECLVTKIMTEARELLKCERCAVFLLDTDCGEAGHLERILERPGTSKKGLKAIKGSSVEEEENVPCPTAKQARFTTVFELGTEEPRRQIRHDAYKSSTLLRIAVEVARTKQALNISDVSAWRVEPETNRVETRIALVSDYNSDDNDCSGVKTILCMPIVNANKTVIGVAQLINKENGNQFSESDVSIFEAFAIFCGLGIHNTQMYENACKLMAKQKVALECLSYHATASADDTGRLSNDLIPSAENFNLYSFTFHDFDLSDDDTCRATLRMFLECNLVQQFHIPHEVLCRWILSVKKNYRPVKYHNWRHALNVAQTMFAMLKTGKLERFMSDLEILGLLVACLCHDLDHRGTNNAFQTKTESPLAILYSTSTMEHHHFDQCVMILNSDSNNIFQALSPSDYKRVMNVVETAILSTDLAMYFKKRSKFLELVDNGEFDWQSEEKKELLCGMMMTACDVSAIAKPWEVQHKVAKLVADEFFDQGDLERLQLNQQPIAMMDRERKDELPQMQVGFIDVICLPLYKVMADTFPWIQPLYNGTMENRKKWQDLAEKVEMGLTWIDHDTIDKPIEEFAGSSDAIKDVELTITTLNCWHDKAGNSGATGILGAAGIVSGMAGASTPGTAPNSLGKTTRFHSLRRGKAASVISRMTRSKLTRSLYTSPTSQDDKGAKASTSKGAAAEAPARDNGATPQETTKQSSHKHKNKLCKLL